MSQSEMDRLVQMINQIAINNISAGDENAVAEVIAGHVQKFWSRRMKQMLSAYVEQGGEELHPAAKLAAEKLRAQAA